LYLRSQFDLHNGNSNVLQAREQANGLPPGMSISAQPKTKPSIASLQPKSAASALVAANNTSKNSNTSAISSVTSKAPAVAVVSGTASVGSSALVLSPSEDEAFKELRKLKKKLRRIEEQEALGALTADQTIAKAALLNEIELLEK
jgi:hypothetical protein